MPGTKVGFSNLGPEAGIGAPGGNCVNARRSRRQSVRVLDHRGSEYRSHDARRVDVHGSASRTSTSGTSFSGPLVAGAAALVHSLNSQLTPAQYILLLKDSATPFPTEQRDTHDGLPRAGRRPAGRGMHLHAADVRSGDAEHARCGARSTTAICTRISARHDSSGTGGEHRRTRQLRIQRPHDHDVSMVGESA